MKVVERNVMRLVAAQHLRSAYGIKTKNWNKNKAAGPKLPATGSAKVFGVPLENLPYYNMEHGRVPSFLVDACMKLMAHVDTEGLFRKSGSIVRLKALRAKLDAGEECLSSALPGDVAGLVKQFFRELPEPVLPAELSEVFLKAQQLPSEEERSAATLLLSCVLPDRILSVLQHFFDFLHNVSRRSAENKMDSSNLSVILAPNLLHSGEAAEKMNSSTEKRLKLQAAVVRCFIENAKSFGVLPQFLVEKVPAMMGCDGSGLSTPQDGLDEPDINSTTTRRRRRSLGVFSSATPVIATPSSKRKLPLESGQSFGFSNKKRRSIKKNLGLDLLPNSLFSGTSTPGSAYSATEVLESSQNVPSAGRSGRQSAARRKSRRLSGRHTVSRVESGRAGCFSPKGGKKEAPRKSLRMRFSLGKSSKESGSETIGWRLATQESTVSFCATKDAEFTPAARRDRPESKSSKHISKSEDNLLTPQCNPSAYRTSWNGETPRGSMVFGGGSFTDTPVSLCFKSAYHSEPAIVVSKPPAGAGLPKKLCCASSAESLESEGSPVQARARPPVPEINVLEEPCQYVQNHSPSPAEVPVRPCVKTSMPLSETPTLKVMSDAVDELRLPTPKRHLADEQNITFSQMEMVPMSPLHIDSTLFETGPCYGSAVKRNDGSPGAAASSPNNSQVGAAETEVEQVNCSRLIDALDIQSPAHFKLGVSVGSQSTPCRSGRRVSDEPDAPFALDQRPGTVLENMLFSLHGGTEGQARQPVLELSPQMQKLRVADRIQHFNKLTLYSPKSSKASKRVMSPLKFQRTPVQQSIRRINSLLGDSRRPPRDQGHPVDSCGPGGKAVSLDSVFVSGPQLRPFQGEDPPEPGKVRAAKKPPPVPPKKPSTLSRKPKACALGDVTNKVQPKIKADCADPPGGQKSVLQQVADRPVNHYKGSPRHPLSQARLLSATKPIDL